MRLPPERPSQAVLTNGLVLRVFLDLGVKITGLIFLLSKK